LIRLENISIKGSNPDPLFKDLNIFIPSGSIVSIDGSPRMGKTKLFKTMALLEMPYKGSVHLLGKNINKLSRTEISTIHREIGIVYQNNFFVHDFNLEYNIIFPLILKGEKIIDIKLALKELLPWLQLEGLMKNSISQSSYVELKLAQFARAIIGRPRILLLDNFFSDLEENMEKKINYLILALNKIGTSIIIFGPPPKGDTIKFNKKYKINEKGLIEIERKSLSL
jgi:ABC-type ATPase involved in cell division